MGSRAEGGLGHAHHRDAELSVRVRAEPGAAAGVEVGVAVDYQKAQPAEAVQDRAHGREFTQIELTRLAGQHLCHGLSAFIYYLCEAGIGGHHRCCSRTLGTGECTSTATNAGPPFSMS